MQSVSTLLICITYALGCMRKLARSQIVWHFNGQTITEPPKNIVDTVQPYLYYIWLRLYEKAAQITDYVALHRPDYYWDT